MSGLLSEMQQHFINKIHEMRQTEKGDWIIFTDIWLLRSTISRKCARLPGTASCGCVLFHGDWNRTGEIPKPDCPEFPCFAECDSVSPDENRKRLICRAKRVSSSCYPRIPNESGHPAASRFCRHFPSGQRKPAPHPHDCRTEPKHRQSRKPGSISRTVLRLADGPRKREQAKMLPDMSTESFPHTLSEIMKLRLPRPSQV